MPETTANEEKSSRSYWGFVLWPLAVLVLYVLSYGPAIKAAEKGILSNKLMPVYRPLQPIIHRPTLGKPLRMYLHLWCPQVWTGSGDWVV